MSQEEVFRFLEIIVLGIAGALGGAWGLRKDRPEKGSASHSPLTVQQEAEFREDEQRRAAREGAGILLLMLVLVVPSILFLFLFMLLWLP